MAGKCKAGERARKSSQLPVADSTAQCAEDQRCRGCGHGLPEPGRQEKGPPWQTAVAQLPVHEWQRPGEEWPKIRVKGPRVPEGVFHLTAGGGFSSGRQEEARRAWRTAEASITEWHEWFWPKTPGIGRLGEYAGCRTKARRGARPRPPSPIGTGGFGQRFQESAVSGNMRAAGQRPAVADGRGLPLREARDVLAKDSRNRSTVTNEYPFMTAGAISRNSFSASGFSVES